MAKIGWLEYNWKMNIGVTLCRWFGHKGEGAWGRCSRCLRLWASINLEQDKNAVIEAARELPIEKLMSAAFAQGLNGSACRLRDLREALEKIRPDREGRA